MRDPRQLTQERDLVTGERYGQSVGDDSVVPAHVRARDGRLDPAREGRLARGEACEVPAAETGARIQTLASRRGE